MSHQGGEGTQSNLEHVNLPPKETTETPEQTVSIIESFDAPVKYLEIQNQ